MSGELIEFAGTVFEVVDNDVEDAINGYRRMDCSPKFEIRLEEYPEFMFGYDGPPLFTADEGDEVVLFVNSEILEEAKKKPGSIVSIEGWKYLYEEEEEGSCYADDEIRDGDGRFL